METDLAVLVVGGGPVGLFAAHELCRHGVSPKRIRIIDKRRKQKLWCKAVGVQSRSQEIIYASSQNLSNAIQESSLKVNNASFYRYPADCNQNGKTFKNNELILKANLNGLQSQFNNMAVVEQYNTEKFIEKELNEKFDIKLERGIELIDFKDKGSFVEVKLRKYHDKKTQNATDEEKSIDNDKNIEILRVGYLIGCDGARSFVRSKLDLPFIGETYTQKFILFHGELNDKGTLPYPVGMIISGMKGLIFTISLKDKSWYLICDLDEKQQIEINKRHNGKMVEPTESDIEYMLKHRGMNDITIKSTKWLSSFQVESKQITQYSKGRVYLAGDACHIHSPVLGQGMNMGLQDAANLSWKLAMVINKKCSASLLVSYNTERYNVDNSVLKLVDTATRNALLRNSFALALTKSIQRAVGQLQFLIDAAVQTTGQITYSYRNYSELSFEYWKPPPIIPFVLYRRQQNITRIIRNRLVAGDRCPDFVIPLGNEEEYSNRRLYQLFRVSMIKPFIILLFEGNPDFNVPFSDYKDLNVFKQNIETSECGEYCKVIIIKSIYAKLNELFGVYQQCLFLIRPDQYIGLRSQPLSLDALRYYLTKKLYINNIRIDDDSISKVKNMESIDPVPTILLTVLIAGLSYIIGNKVLPFKYKPNKVIDKIYKSLF